MSVVIHLTSFTSESSGRGKEEDDSRDRKRERGRKLLKVKTTTINSSAHSSSFYVSRGLEGVKTEKSCVCVLKGKRAFVC